MFNIENKNLNNKLDFKLIIIVDIVQYYWKLFNNSPLPYIIPLKVYTHEFG